MRSTTLHLQLLLAVTLATGCVHTAPVPTPTHSHSHSSSPSPGPAPGPSEAEVGQASFYGAEFEGRPTASGEPYRGEALTCAHRTLPFGTVLEVEREDTGDRVEVRVNDRGPHVQGRVVDVSHQAAVRLKLVKDGVATVRVRVVKRPDADAEHLPVR